MQENHSYTHFIGIDVAKKWLDLALMDASGKFLAEHRVKNTAKSLNSRFNIWQKKFGLTTENVLFCAENTGIYNTPLLNFALENQAVKLWVEHPLQIKMCTGVVRAVDDQLAAKRIAQYAFRYLDRLKIWAPEAEVLQQIRVLATHRKRLVVQRKQTVVPYNEMKLLNPKMAALVKDSTQSLVKELDKQIQAMDAQIEAALAKDPALQRQADILQSIPGVGKVTATQILIGTQQFTRFETARQFACFCGIAPFEQTSGSSVRKRPRVSKQADNQLKTALQLAALAAVRSDPELKAYYKRKVEQGKNKMSVLNAVRNKLIHRMFSLIRRNETFKTKENFAAAA